MIVRYEITDLFWVRVFKSIKDFYRQCRRSGRDPTEFDIEKVRYDYETTEVVSRKYKQYGSYRR